MIPRIISGLSASLVEVSLSKSATAVAIFGKSVTTLVMNQTSPDADSLVKKFYVAEPMKVEF